MRRLWRVLLTGLLQGVAQIAFLYNSEHQNGSAHNGIGFSTSSTDLENALKAFLKPDPLEAFSQLSFPHLT